MIKLNGARIEPTIFPDKTSQIWNVPVGLLNQQPNVIDWEFESEAEFIHIAQLKCLINTYFHTRTILNLSYLPYARQDKKISNDSTFALRTFAKLINELSFEEVNCCDPHSDVSADLIDNLKVTYPVHKICEAYGRCDAEVVCYPDQGARTKYSKLLPYSSIYAEKERDQKTGEVKIARIIGNPINQNVLIVDDICDGGATFIKLADFLNPLAKKVNLYVSHGIFSKGIQILKDAGISRIFTKEGEVK